MPITLSLQIPQINLLLLISVNDLEDITSIKHKTF